MKLLPPSSTCAKLFVTGATIGPVIDSLHNQCLLRYDFAPLSLSAASWSIQSLVVADQTCMTTSLFCSSWIVPPLLGIAYVVLGGILPRLLSFLSIPTVLGGETKQLGYSCAKQQEVRTKAVIAVCTTALIIKFSEFLVVTHPNGIPIHDAYTVAVSNSSNFHPVLVLLVIALVQWALLDGTPTSLLAATIASVGGPLSELVFVANGFWHYLPQVSDYVPLATIGDLGNVGTWFLGDNNNYHELALSSITGPCYFAVTTDAIALGRWFDSSTKRNDTKLESRDDTTEMRH